MEVEWGSGFFDLTRFLDAKPVPTSLENGPGSGKRIKTNDWLTVLIHSIRTG